LTLKPETKTTIGAAGAVCVAIVSFALWMDRRLGSLETKVAGAYTLAAASEQALRLAMENPGLRVPDPRDPSSLLPVVARVIPPGEKP
jgi:hypothetical protein